MHFCSVCGNMYYIGIGEGANTNKLVYYCRKCGNKDETLSVENMCVSRYTAHKTEMRTKNLINKYTKYDPTLPRITGVLCPNEECSSNHGAHEHDREPNVSRRIDTAAAAKDHEVIYIRYDNENMKYAYICPDCDTTWTL